MVTQSKVLFYFFVTAMAMGCHFVKSINKDTSRPNVIIIFMDDMGYSDVGCFGARGYETPYLDQLAKEGAKLTQFYTAQPVCSAARAALLTGCYSNRVGIHQALMPESKTGLNPEETTIADMLKNEGYHTAIFGKWHLGDHPDFMPLNQGFDEYFGIPYSNDMWPKHPEQGPVFNFKPLYLYENNKVIDSLTDQSQLTTLITERAADFISRYKNEPFFLYVPHPQPHVPLFVSEKFKDKSGTGLYGDVIMELDWSVGQIMKALKLHHLEENTLVVFTSDNGPWLAYGNHSGRALPMREGKGTVWEGGVIEPCIMRLPGVIQAGTTIETPLMTIDLLPTIASLCRAPLPKKKIDGKNVIKVISGKTNVSPHEVLYYYYGKNELQAIRYKDWKMYFPHTYRTMTGQPQGHNGKPGPYRNIKIEKAELYDLKNDPSESTNIAHLHPEVLRHISDIADDMRIRLGDSLTGVTGKENRAPGIAR